MLALEEELYKGTLYIEERVLILERAYKLLPRYLI